MTRDAVLTRQQLDRVRAAATVLLPGTADSPAPTALADFDALLQQAALAIGAVGSDLVAAIDALPMEPSWDNLSAFAELDPTAFELVSVVAVGAYFMSPPVLASLGLPSGDRRPASPEQVVDELSTGILDAVLERGSPVRSLQEVNSQANT